MQVSMRKKIAFLAATLVFCMAAVFAACSAFVFGVTADPLPDHVRQLVLTSGGKAPIVWNGEKLLFDSGDVVDGEFVLEPGYGLGDMEVFVNGEPLTLEKKDIAGNYIFSFTIYRDTKLTFKGAPALAPRTVLITGSGADGVFLEAGGEVFGLPEGEISLELATPAAEPFTFRVYSDEYTKMPSKNVIGAATLGNYSPTVEPFYADGKGGVECTFRAGINALHITLAAGKAKGAPRVDLIGNPGGMFYTAFVDGVPLTDGKFPLSSFEDGEAQLTLALTDEGQKVWDAMSADGASPGMKVNGVPVTADVLAEGGSTAFTVPLKPAYEYASGEVSDLFLFEVETAIPEAAAEQNGYAYVRADAVPAITWYVYDGAAFLCDEQPSLVFADGGGAYYAPGGYVCFDAWVPIGVRATVPSYTFKVHSGGASGGAQEIAIYDVDEEAGFEADTSSVKVLLTSEYRNSEEIGNFMLPYVYRYKVAVSPGLLTAEGAFTIEFVYDPQ